jgi:hypothetical protein
VRNSTTVSYQFPNFMRFAVPFGYEPREQHSSLSIDAVGPALWRELFLSIETSEQLEAWKAKIPKYSCTCANFYAEHERNNPPQFPLSARWKYDLKSAVNAKLGHANITYQEACHLWGWE